MNGSAFLLAMLILSALAASPQDAPPCDCADVQAAAIVFLNEMQMSPQVKHIEMQPDQMGNHVNFRGVVVFELMVGKNGRVLNARAISGHPIAIHVLLGSVDKWRFKPLIQDGVARQTCGRLTVKFSIVENQPTVEVVRPWSASASIEEKEPTRGRYAEIPAVLRSVLSVFWRFPSLCRDRSVSEGCVEHLVDYFFYTLDPLPALVASIRGKIEAPRSLGRTAEPMSANALFVCHGTALELTRNRRCQTEHERL